MPPTSYTDYTQQQLWNGPAGQAWVEQQALLDALFLPLETVLRDAVAASGAGRVLDVGCGTGAVTLAIARQLGQAGRSSGVDVSEAMLALARARAADAGLAADFVCADAQRHAFEPASYDLIVSRFGVMFFDDPVVAFANLARAARGGALRAIAWRGAAENPFMTTAERAVADLLPLPPRVPDAPGQFAFADRDHVAAILQRAGWSEVELQPLDVACRLPEAALPIYLGRLGPVGMALQQADAELREHVLATARAAFAPFVHGDEVRFTAACWMLQARA